MTRPRLPITAAPGPAWLPGLRSVLLRSDSIRFNGVWVEITTQTPSFDVDGKPEILYNNIAGWICSSDTIVGLGTLQYCTQAAVALGLIQATKSLIIFHSKTCLNYSVATQCHCSLAAAEVDTWVICYFLPHPCLLFKDLVLLTGEGMHLKTNGLPDT